MGKRGFTPQSASDEVLRQAGKIDNLIPTVNAWLAVLAAAEIDPKTRRPKHRVTDEDHVKAAMGLMAHSTELRTALTALESVANDIITLDRERKSELLDGFLQ